jgi:NADPH-dependent curcumin reductase CurA
MILTNIYYTFCRLQGLRVMGVEAGKTIFVGSAAGGVGQLVGQLAKAQGLHVIGSGM